MMAKTRSTIGSNPLDAVVPQQRQEPVSVPEPDHVPKKAITVRLPVDLIERLQAAAWWSRETVTGIFEAALVRELAAMEKDNGGPFQPPGGRIKTGRRPGS